MNTGNTIKLRYVGCTVNGRARARVCVDTVMQYVFDHLFAVSKNNNSSRSLLNSSRYLII